MEVHPPTPRSALRRLTALLLCLSMMLTLLPMQAAAVETFTVSFVNYDNTDLSQTLSGVPQGARLYTAAELKTLVPSFTPTGGCTWYLYYEGGEDGSGAAAYGPEAIPDPSRDGYVFQDWAASGASGTTDDSVYTVTGNTTFVARYASEHQYVVSLYYRFANDTGTVAADTTTTPYGLGGEIDMALPTQDSLKGLTPTVSALLEGEAAQTAAAAINAMIQSGSFSGTLDDAFLDNCRKAGFVAWDDETGDYARDENGNVAVNIPVTYTLTGTVKFKVAYYQQNAEDDGYTLAGTQDGSVKGTTRVSLQELGLVNTYTGFTLTTASAENAASYDINANGSSVIELYYNRNVHYVYYRMNGGNALDPVPLRYGQAIPDDIGSAHTRPGYTFDSWTWQDTSGATIEEPATMPDHDLTLVANWKGANTKVTLVYWLENANDDGYTVAGQQEITVQSGQTVAYDAGENSVSEADVAINRYIDPNDRNYVAANGVGSCISDKIEYFTFNPAGVDSSTQFSSDTDKEGYPKAAAGDGSTVINVSYTRNEYTLVFHLGQVYYGQPQISTGGNSTSWNPNDWQSGYSGWTSGYGASLTMDGKIYTISNDDADCYQITAKYGAYISDRWPVATNSNTTDVGSYKLYTWGTHHESPYYESHTGNRNIIGVYATMSTELIIKPTDPSVVHHLTAYWNSEGKSKTHHYLFEAVPGATDGETHSFSEYETYSQVSVIAQGGWAAVQGLTFYESREPTQVRTNAEAYLQNAPAFANVTYRYGCYNGNDVYFFYTYDNYTVTYHENNPDLTQPGSTGGIKEQPFHYIADMTLAQELEGDGFDYDYTPSPPFVSAYGNEYIFDGWYTDANLTFPVDWSTENPVSSMNLYAKWKAPTFTLTLIVPGGTLYETSLEQFREKGYTCTVSTEQTADGEITTTYVISDIPGGISSNHIIEQRHGAQNTYGLAFDAWTYKVNGQEQIYLFDESQLVTSDMTLTARWKTDYTGTYTVRYLTAVPQDNEFDTVEIDGTTYYRLDKDLTVTGVAVGSSVTVEARSIDGYLSDVGQLTQVVDHNGQTCYDFIYSKITGQVIYHVHYVLDTGVNYGRTEPTADAIELAQSKTVIVEAASLNNSTTVSEAAPVVSGYTPRDSWNANFTLSASEEQNHLYFYYVSNTKTVDYQVVYHVQSAGGTYDNTNALSFQASDALGKVLTAAELAEHYDQYLSPEDAARLDSLLVGHELDTAVTAPYLLLTLDEEANIIYLYLKNADYTVTYHLNGTGAVWETADSFLKPSDDGAAYTQIFIYPNGANRPTTIPTWLGHTFLGWNTAEDGSGDGYTADTLKDAPWYQPGFIGDVDLYAQWEGQKVVTFDLRGGTWTDETDRFLQLEGFWSAYVTTDDTAPQPADPTKVILSDGTAYAFMGWTTTDPDTLKDLYDEDNRLDQVTFNREHRFDFNTPITEDTTLYAVWDPDVATISLNKTDTNAKPLSGAEFTLERLQTTVTGSPGAGYHYTLETDETGAYLVDETFPMRPVTSDEQGAAAFQNLPAGYYRLTEAKAPDGYLGLSEPVILFAPYGGAPRIEGTPDHVSGQDDSDGNLTVTVENVSQYSFTIDAPAGLTFTYDPPDLIWNPETLVYEDVAGTGGTWDVTAPEPDSTDITVTNTSAGASVTVSVVIQYEANFTALLPLSSLTADTLGFEESMTDNSKTIQGTLAPQAKAVFTLALTGPVRDVALPSTETRAGTLTIRISPA